MKNEKKVILLKILAIAVIILGILGCYFAYIVQTSEETDINFNKYETILGIVTVLGLIDATAIYYLLGHVKIPIKKKKLSNKASMKLNTKSYRKFESNFITNLYNNNFKNEGEIKNNLDCKIKCFIKKELKIINIVYIIRTKEISDELVKKPYDVTSEYLENNIGIEIPYTIYVFCVDKINNNFKKLLDNIEESYFAAGINMSTGEVYIPDYTGGLLKAFYNQMEKRFKKYISNQIIK